MKKITAKFYSFCTETGKTLKKGDTIYFDTETRKAYHITASIPNKRLTDDGAYVRAQEDAYWDNATGGYYSR